MRPPPAGWPRITSAVFYDDAVAAIGWLCRVFGFEVRLQVLSATGHLEHSELTFGDGVIMVGQSGGKSTRPVPLPCVSPKALGVNTQVLCVFVDDVDAHYEAARAAGAIIVEAPLTGDYGDGYWADRTYRAVDVEGHHWWFMQRLRG
jgi:uncharacterized glyoxalase superfamily protein PhnB